MDVFTNLKYEMKRFHLSVYWVNLCQQNGLLKKIDTGRNKVSFVRKRLGSTLKKKLDISIENQRKTAN